MRSEAANSTLSPRRCLCIAIALIGFLVVSIPFFAQEDPGFKVIVHGDNPTGTVEASRLSKVFLKKVKRWDNDIAVVPFDLGERDEVRDLFTRAVHRKSTSAIKSYWQRMIFSGRDVPPDEVDSAEEMLDLVAAEPGGVGYVGSDVVLPSGVRELVVQY